MAGGGNDTIIGGLGSDTLVGGLGADTFVFRAVDMDGSEDVIMDYKSSEGDTLQMLDALNGYQKDADLSKWLRYDVDLSNGVSWLKIDVAGENNFDSPALTLKFENLYSYATLDQFLDVANGGVILA
jgi:surface adhesion protein